MSLPRHSRPGLVVGAGLVAVLALGACSSTGTGVASSAGGGVPAIAPANPEVGAPDASGSAPDAAADAQKLSESAAGSGTAGRSSASPPAADLAAADKLVRTATLQVQVDDVESKAAQARQVAIAAGGMVVSENSSAVPDSSGGVDKQGSRSTLSLAVPTDTLDRVLDDLGKLGTTVQRSSSARDVTASYVDTQSRIATMKAGLDQLRTLLGKTADLNQIVSLETEISRRQADLDSLQAQLNALDKKVAMSTVGLTLVTAANVVVPDEEPSGFVGGLRSGWKAFLGASSGVLTVLGTVLPFLVLAAIVAVPVLWWRRRRTGVAAPSAENAGGARGSGGSGGSGDSGGSGGNGDGGGSDDGGGGSGGPKGPESSRTSIPSEPREASEGLDGGSATQPDEGRGTGQREPETVGVGPR